MTILLGRAGVSGFTSYHARGHGEVNEEMSLAEQVSGRRKRLQFEILMDEADVLPLLDGLADEVGRDIVSGSRWSATPVGSTDSLSGNPAGSICVASSRKMAESRRVTPSLFSQA